MHGFVTRAAGGLVAYDELAVQELDSTIRILSALTPRQWGYPVRCEGWQIDDLARHLVVVVSRHTEICRRTTSGDPELAPWDAERGLATPSDQVVRVLLAARAEFAEAITRMVDTAPTRQWAHDWISASPEVGLKIMAAEQALHRNDLLWAMGDLSELAPEVIRVWVPLLRLLLCGVPLRGEEGDSYVVEGNSFIFGWCFTGGRWHRSTAPRHGSCVIRGSDSAACLFLMGRLSSTDPRLEVTGRQRLAADFKRHFPGP